MQECSAWMNKKFKWSNQNDSKHIKFFYTFIKKKRKYFHGKLSKILYSSYELNVKGSFFLRFYKNFWE